MLLSGFFPVIGSITLIIILSATLNGLASSFFIAPFTKFLKIGNAVFAPVSYLPNDFGLYGMAGNVAEWVADVYRPIIDEEMNDFNYYRGNLYFKPSIDENGKVLTVSSENANYDNLPGSLKNEIEDENSIDRTNYSKGDNRDFNDGDRNSVRDFKLDGEYSKMYNSPDQNNQFEESTTLINNEARVYKGGSWLDRAYYLDPAQRRYYPESMTSNFIGFRCAMSYFCLLYTSPSPRD